MEQIETRVNKAILVGVNLDGRENDKKVNDSMEELEELVKAAGAEVVAVTVQNKSSINAAYFIGKGKVEEIAELCKIHEVNLVVFNDELSGSQIRNLEETIKVDVIDRTTIILDIFAQRAQTKEGKLQVELAQLKYRLPRLTGLGNKLSRQGAGIGTRGPGEMKLETDRRHILRRIDDIKKQLKEVRKNRETQRSQRIKSELPIVALVGYTNAGKSTLMNTLLRKSLDYDEKKEVYVKNQLFATLDTTLRKVYLSKNETFLLTDTVGFVSKLPHDLVDAFKSTLEEVKYADLLLHVIDISNENYELQMETTLNVLKELGADTKEIIHVFNKCDLLEGKAEIPQSENTLIISAKTGENLDKLFDAICNFIGKKTVQLKLLIPYSEGHVLSQLHKEAEVLDQNYEEVGISMNIKIDKTFYEKYQKYQY